MVERDALNVNELSAVLPRQIHSLDIAVVIGNDLGRISDRIIGDLIIPDLRQKVLPRAVAVGVILRALNRAECANLSFTLFP